MSWVQGEGLLITIGNPKTLKHSCLMALRVARTALKHAGGWKSTRIAFETKKGRI